ncbi:acetylcholine receptor subunit alpha-type acr-16-like [Physella acuta]|uniref:acetylcholine receptor subunit alpha-type acr-16-like n=1 Tax=Physella acuta TaxID=109671 RepID=UPI0027DB716C|nr:acetylcholine receptor subunit alpha-type acr-16-like [Physella acuta]
MYQDMSPEREGLARLYEDLAKQKVTQNKLSSLPTGRTVNVRVGVSQVLESKQTIETQLYFEMSWNDKDLAWDAQNYSNWSFVSLPSGLLWHPEVFVLNIDSDSGTNYLLPESNTVLLNSSGVIVYRLLTSITTFCNFDLTYYPFDTQTCIIVMGLNGDGVTILVQPSILNDSVLELDIEPLQGEWAMLDKRFEVKTSNLNIPYVKLYVSIRRATLYYILCVVTPMVVTSLLTLVVFWIPPDSGEKMSFMVSIYMSTSLFLSFVGSTMPRNLTKTEKIPRIMLFISFIIIEGILSIIATVYVMRKYRQEQKLLPDGKDAKNSKIATSGTVTPMACVEDNVSVKKDNHESCSLKEKMICYIKTKVNNVSAESVDRLFFAMFLTVSVPFYALVFVV